MRRAYSKPEVAGVSLMPQEPTLSYFVLCHDVPSGHVAYVVGGIAGDAGPFCNGTYIGVCRDTPIDG